MAEFDNAELLSDIRDRGSLPSADLRFTDAKLLAAATIELRDVIAALLVESQANRMVYLYDRGVTAGLASYGLPSRAVAGRWQSVGWKGSGDSSWTRLRQVHPEDYYLQSDTAKGQPTGFFVRDNALVLVPTPSAAGTLRLPYYMRPNKLVSRSEVAVVTNVDGTEGVEISAADAALFNPTETVDVVRATPGFETLLVSDMATFTDGGSGTYLVTFESGVPAGIAVGDYICYAGQSPVAQCPVEVRGLLAARAARRALIAVNEAQQASMLDNSVAELTEVARSLLSPRVDAEPQEWGDVRRGLLYGVLQ
jgi:hypothetical protein